MKKDKILVTGGAGFIGSHFVDLAILKGHDVVVLDKMTYASNEANLEDALNTCKAVLIRGDICDPAIVSKILLEHDITKIVHFAAESHVDNSIEKHRWVGNYAELCIECVEVAQCS